jgi:hypothetical protein
MTSLTFPFHPSVHPAAGRPSALPRTADHAPACSLKARPRPAVVTAPSWEDLLGRR